MWASLGIGKKLGFGFGVVVLLAVFLGLISWSKIQDINAHWTDFESVTLAKQNAVSEAQIGLQEGIQHFKNYVLRAGDYAEKFSGDMNAIGAGVAAYRQAGSISSAEEKLLGEVERGIQTYRAAMLQAVQLHEAGQGSSDIDRAIKGADQALNAAFRQLRSINAENTRQASAEIDQHVASASAWLASVSLFIVVLASLIALKVTHDIVHPLDLALSVAKRVASGDLTARESAEQAAGDELGNLLRALCSMRDELAGTIRVIIDDARHLNEVACQLSATAQQVAAGSDSQSQSTATAAAAVEQLTVGIDHVGSSADDASRRAIDAGQIAARGGGEVQAATQHMGNVASSVDSTAQDIQNLSEQVQRIGGIAIVIREVADQTKVADQTNLLALNAAIEAARAGEQGRGFAVVADEVRKLAERTSSSVREITATTDAIRIGAEAAVLGMQKSRSIVSEVVSTAETAVASMHGICQATEGVRSTISDISNALHEQRSASTELARSVENIAQMSEENATAVGQVAATASDLARVSSDLRSSVARFRL